MVSLLAQLHDAEHATPPASGGAGGAAARGGGGGGGGTGTFVTLAAHYCSQPADRLTGFAQVAMAWAQYIGSVLTCTLKHAHMHTLDMHMCTHLTCTYAHT